MPSKPSLVQLIIHIQLDYFFFTLKLISYLLDRNSNKLKQTKIKFATNVATSIQSVISSPHFQEKPLYKICIYRSFGRKDYNRFFFEARAWFFKSPYKCGYINVYCNEKNFQTNVLLFKVPFIISIFVLL
mgnify:CR=1 FL=1